MENCIRHGMLLILFMALGGSPIESRSHSGFLKFTLDTCNTPGYQCTADCHSLQLCAQLGPSYQLINVLACTSDGLYCDADNKNCSVDADVCQVVVPFKCNMAGTFPDPYDCTLYHVCEEEGGEGTATYCASGYAFDALSGACNISTDNIVCTAGPVPECLYPGQTGALDRNPAIYYICSEEGPMLYICPHGQYNNASYSCQDTSVPTESSDTSSETTNTDSSDTSSETTNTDSSDTSSETTNTDSSDTSSETTNTDSSDTSSETTNTDSSDTSSETTNTDFSDTSSETTNTDSSDISSETTNTDSSDTSSETTNTDSSDTSSETTNTDFSDTSSETTNTDSSDTSSETTNADSSDTSSETTNADSSDTSSETTNTDSSDTSSETTNTDASDTSSETTNTDSSDTSSETTNTDTSSETTNTDSSDTSSETTNTDSSDTSSETTNTDSSDTSSETTNTDSSDTSSDTTSQGTTAAADTCSTAGYACSTDCNRVELCLDTGTSLDLIVMTTCVKGQTSCNLSLLSCTSVSDCHPVVPFKCNMQGVFPDPYNCTLYHYCAGREAQPVTTRCAEGLAYDASTYACDLKVTSSVCRSNQVPECTHTGQTGALTINPSIYYICVDGSPQLYMCTHGTYNPALYQCVD